MKQTLLYNKAKIIFRLFSNAEIPHVENPGPGEDNGEVKSKNERSLRSCLTKQIVSRINFLFADPGKFKLYRFTICCSR